MNKTIISTFVISVIIIGSLAGVLMINRNKIYNAKMNNFNECVRLSGQILESDPPQCYSEKTGNVSQPIKCGRMIDFVC